MPLPGRSPGMAHENEGRNELRGAGWENSDYGLSGGGPASSSRGGLHSTGHASGSRTPTSIGKDGMLVDRRSGEMRHRSSFSEDHIGARSAEGRPPASVSGGTLRELEERLHGVEREARDALASMENSSAYIEPGLRSHAHSPAPSRGRLPQGSQVAGRQAAAVSGRAGHWSFDPSSSSPGTPRSHASRRPYGTSAAHHNSRGPDDASELLCQQWETWAAEVNRATDEGGTLPPPPPSPPALAGLPHALIRVTEAAVAAATTLAREGRDARMLRISVDELSSKLMQSKADARQLCDRVSELMRVHSTALRASEAEASRLAGTVQELTDQNSDAEDEMRRMRERSSELANALAAEAHDRRQIEESLSRPCEGCGELRGEISRLAREIERMRSLINDGEAQRIMDEREWKRALDDSDVQRRSIVGSLRQLLVHHDIEPTDSDAIGPAEHGRLRMPPIALPREEHGASGSPRERWNSNPVSTSRARTPARSVHNLPTVDTYKGDRGGLSDSGVQNGISKDHGSGNLSSTKEGHRPVDRRAPSIGKDEDWALAQANILSATRDIEAEIVELHRTLRESAGTPRSGHITPDRPVDADGGTGGGSKTQIVDGTLSPVHQSSASRVINESIDGC